MYLQVLQEVNQIVDAFFALFHSFGQSADAGFGHFEL